jgi:lipid-A-disaccharide synthase
MGKPVRIALVAGEASGDLLASHLIAALKERLPDARFCGIGGPKMESQGFDAWWPQEKLAVMGYWDALKHYREIAGIRRQLKKRLLEQRPDVFIGVDAPDFNLGLEKDLKRAGIRTCITSAVDLGLARRVGQENRARGRTAAGAVSDGTALYEKARVR